MVQPCPPVMDDWDRRQLQPPQIPACMTDDQEVVETVERHSLTLMTRQILCQDKVLMSSHSPKS